MFAKLVVSMQIFLAFVEVLVRHARGLPISLLELTVTAYGTFAIATCVLLLQKPKDVQTSHCLRDCMNTNLLSLGNAEDSMY
jgi:hypothetical protein